MERALLDYLPDYLREYPEIRAIMEAEQGAVDDLWADLYAVLDGMYISTAGDAYLARWEAVLRIDAKPTSTLDERRFSLLARLNENLPYTLNRLRQQLSTLCGAEGYRVALNPGAYTLGVKVDLGVKSKYNDVAALLERMVPANIIIDLSLLYNTHEVLSGFTHAQLAAYTHHELREEVLSVAR